MPGIFPAIQPDSPHFLALQPDFLGLPAGGSFYIRSIKITLPQASAYPFPRRRRYNLLQASNLGVPWKRQFGISVDYTKPERVRKDDIIPGFGGAL